MTQPIHRTQSSYDPSSHYDTEASICVAPAAAGSVSKAADLVLSEPDQGARAAVDQLVRSVDAKQPNDCFDPVLDAGLTCAAGILGVAASAASGPGAVAAAVLAGGACGLRLSRAADCWE